MRGTAADEQGFAQQPRAGRLRAPHARLTSQGKPPKIHSADRRVPEPARLMDMLQAQLAATVLSRMLPCRRTAGSKHALHLSESVLDTCKTARLLPTLPAESMRLAQSCTRQAAGKALHLLDGAF